MDRLQQVEIIYNQGQIMTSGHGNSKQQAERNASIRGLEWLHEHKAQEIRDMLHKQKFSQSLKASFIQHSNMGKF